MDSDSSESGENDDIQNNQNRKFNKIKTEIIEKCVTEVLKLIRKALIKDTICRKEQIKTIKKNKKPKPNEKVVANQIQRLCNEIKAIASTLANPAAEVPQSSKYCDIVPGTSRSNTEHTPGKFSMETIEPGSSRILSNRFDTTKSVTSQGNTELVLGNVRNRAEGHKSLVSCSIRDCRTSSSGVAASSGIPGSFIERDPGPSRSYLQPRIPEPSRSMEIPKASMIHSNVVECGTLRHSKTAALEISNSHSKIKLVFSKSTVVSAPKTSGKPVKESSNSHTVTHIGTGGNPKALFGIFANRSEVSSPRSCFLTEVCEAPAISSNAAVTNTSRNMGTVVSEILSASTNKIPGATKNPAQTILTASKIFTKIDITETSDSCTKPVKEASKTHHGTDGSCIEATLNIPETLVEAATEPSKSLSKTKDPESSRRYKEKEVSEAPASSSNAAVTNTSRNMETVVTVISSASTNKIPGATKSPAQTTLKASKNCTEIGITETSDGCTKPVKIASKTHHGADRICIQATPSTPETLIEAATGSSRSLSRTKEPETSRRNKKKKLEKRKSEKREKKMRKEKKRKKKKREKRGGRKEGEEGRGGREEEGKSSSDAAITNTSRNTKTVVLQISSDFSNTIPGTAKSHTQTTPEPSKNYAKTVVTETSESATKYVKEALKMHHGTDGSCIQTTPGTPETIAEAGTTASSNLSKTKDPESSRRNTETEALEITTSRLDVAECGNLRHTNTITPDTSSCRTNAIPVTSKKDSNAVANETSSNKTDAITIGMSGNVNTVVANSLLNKRENIAHEERNSSQICTKTKVNISGSEEINNNNTTKRNTEANLKRNFTISNNDDPKRAKIEHTCTLCGKVINNEDLAKHYKERHGMHHEIKHNNENYEHKIQDLNKRLQIPMDTSKSNNEQKDKITPESKKRTEARSFSAPNEGTVAKTAAGINVDSDKVEEPTEKKKRTARSDSTPNENIEPTNATTLKAEHNRNTALEDFIVDLTDDNNLHETEPPTNVREKKCSPNPVDDYQVLKDHPFVDLSDDTSLYDIPKEEIKSAEALLLENVKEEQATICHDVEVVSNYLPTISNNKNSSDKKRQKTTEHSADETKEKLAHQESLQTRNYCKELGPGASRRGSLIDNTKYRGTDKKHTKVTKPKTSNNPTKLNVSENSVSRTEVGFGTAGNRTEFISGTSVTVPRIETLESSKNKSKQPGVSINQHLTQTKQRKAEHGSSKRRTDKRKSPYENPNKTFSNTNRISSGSIATKTSLNASKVVMINATTTQRIQTNDHVSGENNFSTGNIPTRVKPEVLKTTDSLIQHTDKTKPNSDQKHTFKSKNTSELKTDSLAGLGIKNIDAPNESLPNAISVSLPSSTTITPIQVTQKANHTPASNSINAKGVSQTMSVPPTTSTNIISTSNIVKSAIQKQSMLQTFYSAVANFPPGLNIASQKKNSVTQNTSTPISSSASVSLQNKPASVSLQSNHQTSSPLIKSNHPQPGASTSQFCHVSRNTQNVNGNIKPAPSTSVQSAPKQHSTVRTNKSDIQITSNTPRRKSVPASDHSDRKKTNTSVDLQSPQIQWYPPIILGDQNTLRSNVASRNANRRAAVNLNDAHPQKYSWHTPVEPDERPETSTNASQSVTLNNLSSSFLDPVEIRHQRPNNQRIADTRQQSSNSEVGWQNLLTPRPQSTLLQDQGLRLPQTGRTWHTPVKSPTQN